MLRYILVVVVVVVVVRTPELQILPLRGTPRQASPDRGKYVK